MGFIYIMFFFIKGNPNVIKVALDIVNIPRLDEKDEVSIYKNNMIISNIRNSMTSLIFLQAAEFSGD